jgi:hypothetical protein
MLLFHKKEYAMRRFYSLLLLTALLAILAACAPAQSGGGAPTATVIPASAATFGSVTVGSEVFAVQGITAVDIDGQVSITVLLANNAIVSFGLPSALLTAGEVPLGFPDTSESVASYATADQQLVSDSGNLILAQTAVGFSAEFSFAAIPPVSDSAQPAAISVSGTLTDIRLADERG